MLGRSLDLGVYFLFIYLHVFVQTSGNGSSHGRYLTWLTMLCQRLSLCVQLYLTKQTQYVQTGGQKEQRLLGMILSS